MSASPALLRPTAPGHGRRSSGHQHMPHLAGLTLASHASHTTQPPSPHPAISLLLERRDGDIADRFTSLAVAPEETVQSVKLRVAQRSAFTSNHVLVLGNRELLDHERLGQLAASKPGGSRNLLHVVIKLSDIESVSVGTSAGRTIQFQAGDDAPKPIRRSKSALTAMLESSDRSPSPARSTTDLALARASSVPPDAVVHLIIHTQSAKIDWHHQSGSKLELTIAANATAETLAAELEQQHQLPPGSHQLVHNGEVLLASRSLASYGIDSSAVLELVPLDGPLSSFAASGSPPLSSPEHSLFANWQAAQKGLKAGLRPLLAACGSGGSYFMSNAAGDTVAVLKPADEEPFQPNNPRSLSLGASPDGSGLRRGVRPGEGVVREVAAFVLDHGHFAGVPPTAMVTCRGSQLPGDVGGSAKVCSLQQYVHAAGDCEERGVSAFPVHEVHKIAQLDLRLANADRNGSNVLCKQAADGTWTLTPIDHGYCLPDTFSDLCFEWLGWSQAHVPFDNRTREYIARLDADKDLETLAAHGLPLRSECKRVFKACTLLLKMGAARGMTPFAIGSIMSRELRMKSPLEKLHIRALQLSRGIIMPTCGAQQPVSQDKAYFTELQNLLEEYLDEVALDGVLS